MAMQSNVVSVKRAALEKAVSRQAIYRALDEGRLTEIKLEGIRLIRRDRKYRDYVPRPYADKQQDEANQ